MHKAFFGGEEDEALISCQFVPNTYFFLFFSSFFFLRVYLSFALSEFLNEREDAYHVLLLLLL